LRRILIKLLISENLFVDLFLTRNDLAAIEIRNSAKDSWPMRRTEPGNLDGAATAVLAAALLAAPQVARAERLTRETEQAFARYVYAREALMGQEIARRSYFLWIDVLPRTSRDQALADLRNGKVLIEHDLKSNSADTTQVPGGLVHDWTGVVFIPGVSIAKVISTLQDYDQAALYYKPQVVKSKLLEHSGDDFRVYLRLKQVHVITVVLDTDYQVHYTFLDAAHVTARSYSVRIAEIRNVGEPREREMPPGDDDGFLWRLDSYWRFYQTESGVYVQCNAISLTRDVPAGLGWLVGRFLETIPRDSLRFTLESTRNAVMNQVHEQRPANKYHLGDGQHER
jgi:hypothetical protein